MFNMFLLL